MDIEIGKRFSRLVVLRRHGSLGNAAAWLCQCDCGAVVRAAGNKMRQGKKKSCGCLLKEIVKTTSLKHGHYTNRTPSKSYSSWRNMKNRCLNPKVKAYQNYGGRGITVCERWMSFENFYADMGDPPAGMTLEREDNNLGYSPNNCSWATRADQAKNRRNVALVEISGVKKPLTHWALEMGVSVSSALQRRSRGWSVLEALQIQPRSRAK